MYGMTTIGLEQHSMIYIKFYEEWGQSHPIKFKILVQKKNKSLIVKILLRLLYLLQQQSNVSLFLSEKQKGEEFKLSRDTSTSSEAWQGGKGTMVQESLSPFFSWNVHDSWCGQSPIVPAVDEEHQ